MKLFFPKRIAEPKAMGKAESLVFDNLAKTNYKQWFVPFVDEAIKFLTKSEGNILDVGSGPGLLVKEFSSRSKKIKVIGVDISDMALKIAKQNNKGKKNVKFIRASAEKLPFPDHVFDLVTCKDSLHHFSNPQKFFREAWRVCKPNGKIYIQDLKRDLPPGLLRQAEKRDTILKKLQYYSARAAYLKPEIEKMLASLKIRSFKVAGLKIGPAQIKRYKKKGIDPEKLKIASITRLAIVINKK